MKKSASERTPEQTDGVEDEARREALRRFGRYALVAPTAMLLIAPRDVEARGKRKGWDIGWGQGKGRGKAWGRSKGRGGGGGYH